MKLNTGMTVECHDRNVYVLDERTKDNYIIGSADNNSQRLFKPDGSYAGSDKAKNVARIL